MKKIGQVLNAETGNHVYATLYRTGALAALLAALIFRRNLDAEWLLLRGTGMINVGPIETPSSISDWFTLIQNNKLLGLTLLNLFDLVNYALVGLIFLALIAALRRSSRSWTTLATALGFAGITVYFASNQAFSMLSLSNQYAEATTAAQRAMFLAAGQAALAIHQNASYAGRGIYLSFLLVSIAGLIISAVMLHSSDFGKRIAATGILANGFGLSYYLVLAFAPALVFIPLSVSAVFLLIWYLQVSRRLWTLGSFRISRGFRIATSGKQDISHKVKPAL